MGGPWPGRVIRCELRGREVPLVRAGDTVTIAWAPERGSISSSSSSSSPILSLDEVQQRVDKGWVLGRPGWTPPLAVVIRAQIVILDGLPCPILPGSTMLMHVQMAVAECVVEDLERLVEATSGTELKARPRALVRGGQCAVVRLRIPTGGVVCDAVSQTPALGRFALRDQGKTLAVGAVLEVLEEIAVVSSGRVSWGRDEDGGS